MVQITDSRRCGKCHHFQKFEIKFEEKDNPNKTKKRTLICLICGEKLVESVDEGYGNPFKDLGEKNGRGNGEGDKTEKN